MRTRRRASRATTRGAKDATTGAEYTTTRVAALIEARDREIRADECEQAAALVRARVTADNANLGPNGRSLERRAIAKALRERATQHRTEGDTNG